MLKMHGLLFPFTNCLHGLPQYHVFKRDNFTFIEGNAFALQENIGIIILILLIMIIIIIITIIIILYLEHTILGTSHVIGKVLQCET